jgi:hypothetical protein
MGFVEGETVYCSETCVKCDVDGTEEVSIKVEETIDIKEETPEAIIFPPIKTEQEVRLCGVCVVVVVAVHASWAIFCHKKINSEITLNYILLCVILWVPYTL